MKKSNVTAQSIVIFYALVILIMFIGCAKKENDMAPENWLERSYYGTLMVRYTSVYPEWDVTAQMDVVIDKELGAVTVSDATLSYSGETVIDADSKIERSGSWEMYPIGRLEGTLDDRYVFIDAGVNVMNDVQNIYTKDNQGNWQLVNTLDFSGAEPNADLTFDFDDAIISGAVINATSNAGSLTWTLLLTPALD